MSEDAQPTPEADLVSDTATAADPAEAAEAPEAAEVETPTLQDRFRAAGPKATRWLIGGPAKTPASDLRSLAEVAEGLEEPDQWDRYGMRGPVAALESRVADLLGKPAAAMFPSGIMAQQSVLRVWSDRTGSRRVALPALSHLLTYEMDGPQLFNRLVYERLTTGPVVPLAEHLAAIPGRLAAALVELPLRDGGYLLPTFDQLAEFSAAAREREIPVHFDGARLWESQPALGHTLAEIAALADTVYVSLYKGLGGMAGALLAGPQDVVDEARRWRSRHGGTLFSLTAFALGGLRGLDTQLPRMGEYHDRAVAIAAGLVARGVSVFPSPPHTNSFRVFAHGVEDDVNERIVTRLEDAQELVLWPVWPSETPGVVWTELTVGAATLDWSVDEAVDALVSVLL